MVAGFSDDLELSRSQTVMQGASCCDFRFRKKAGLIAPRASSGARRVGKKPRLAGALSRAYFNVVNQSSTSLWIWSLA
jgi:hypothetical protein